MNTKERTMKTEGFVTRKMGRLECDRKMIEMRLRCIDESIEGLLEEAMSLARLKKRVKRRLASVKSDIDKLTPRMKCEEVVVAKAMPLPGTEIDTHGLEKLF